MVVKCCFRGFFVDISIFFVLSPHSLPEGIFFRDHPHTIQNYFNHNQFERNEPEEIEKDNNKAVGFWM